VDGSLSGHVLEAKELPPGGLTKAWWAQAEMLNALGYDYEWTRHRPCLDAFLKLFDWIWAHQIDHECGDWYQEVAWDSGKPLTLEKGLEWKTAFHNPHLESPSAPASLPAARRQQVDLKAIDSQ
jgi:mannose/cellobiose epimerase-like protein (N-acyl-D-glucosamine 2-epimerase family)